MQRCASKSEIQPTFPSNIEFFFFFFPLQASFRKVFKEVAIFQAQSGGGEAESNTSSVCFKYIGALGSCIVVSLLQSPVGKEL